MYYQLDNFYQNHRRYVKSRSFDQLKGLASYSTSDCDPIIKNSDIYTGVTSFVTGKVLDPNANAWPCGLVAKSFFNDTYALTTNGTTPITIVQTGIAWDSDIQYKFKLN